WHSRCPRSWSGILGPHRGYLPFSVVRKPALSPTLGREAVSLPRARVEHLPIGAPISCGQLPEDFEKRFIRYLTSRCPRSPVKRRKRANYFLSGHTFLPIPLESWNRHRGHLSTPGNGGRSSQNFAATDLGWFPHALLFN